MSHDEETRAIPLEINDVQINPLSVLSSNTNLESEIVESQRSDLNPAPEVRISQDDSAGGNARSSHHLMPPDINVIDMAPITPEPLVVRGCGTLVVFGLSSRFPTDFPPNLTGKIASEEYCATIKRINGILHRSQSSKSRWLILACICCFCTLSASLWPVACVAKRTRTQLEKLLDWENNRLYYRLGYRWRLISFRPDSTLLREYAVILEHLPRLYLHIPE